MNHADNPVSNQRGWAVAAWTILVMAAVLGLASDQTSQLISTHFRFGERTIASAATVVESAALPAGVRYGNAPIILTVPFAVRKTQQMLVARVKHRGEFASHVSQLRGGIKAAPGLLAGLALIGASQSSNH